MFAMPKITKLVKIMIIINFVFWILEVLLLRTSLFYIVENMFLVPDSFFSGKVWQVLSYGLLHSPQNIFHIIVNMLMFYFFSYELNMKWGNKRFIIFYILSILMGGVFVILESFIISSNSFVPTVGASAIIFSLTTAYALTFPNRVIYLIFYPIKSKYLIHIDLFIIILSYLAIGQSETSSSAHLGGMFLAFLIIKVPFYKLRYLRKSKRRIKLVK